MDYFNWICKELWGGILNVKPVKNIEKVNLKILEENNLQMDIVKELVVSPAGLKNIN